MTRITRQAFTVRQEPLETPFGFKGGYLTELWQSLVSLEGEIGAAAGMGIGVQSILWSDMRVFARYGELTGNRLMAETTRYALELALNQTYASPLELLAELQEPVYAHAKSLAGFPDLRRTFALNALVAVDQAAWALCAHERRMGFEELVDRDYRSVLTHRHRELASVPVISYGMRESDIFALLEEGYFLLKIKLGSDPDEDGDQDKILKWVCGQLSGIHKIASRYSTPYTENGQIAYYLDANGRYEKKETLVKLLEHADRIGALDRILLFEEPFTEEIQSDISDLPVRFAADESVHSSEDAIIRIEMGFKAFALKPVAETMSQSLMIGKLAVENNIACFCADLTANPLLADWNKNLAARLAPLPGLKIGIIETNGHQNYRNWAPMKSRHPRPSAAWLDSRHGLYRLGEDFFATDGGALEASPSMMDE